MILVYFTKPREGGRVSLKRPQKKYKVLSPAFLEKSEFSSWLTTSTYINIFVLDFALDIGSYMVQTPLILVFSLTDSQCWLSLWFVSLTKEGVF